MMLNLDIAVVEIPLFDQVGFRINAEISAFYARRRHRAPSLPQILKPFPANYGTPDFERLHREANEDTWIIPMIETVQAIGTVRTHRGFLDFDVGICPSNELCSCLASKKIN